MPLALQDMISERRNGTPNSQNRFLFFGGVLIYGSLISVASVTRINNQMNTYNTLPWK